MLFSKLCVDDDTLSTTVNESICVDFPAGVLAYELDVEDNGRCLLILGDR